MQEALEDQVEKIGSKVEQILVLLRGNELDASDNGLIGDVRHVVGRVVKLEKWRDRLIWLVIGMGAPASFGLLDLIHSLLKGAI